MPESRTCAVVAGAAVVIGSLWTPWYAVDFGPAARNAIGRQTDQLPGVFGDFARQLLTLLPSHIELTAWQALEKGDVALLVCALAACFAALLGRVDVAAIAGVAVAGTTVVEMLDRPGPSQIVSLKWGPWLALAGALLIVGASRIGARAAPKPAAPPDWSRPTPRSTAEADAERSFAPF